MHASAVKAGRALWSSCGATPSTILKPRRHSMSAITKKGTERTKASHWTVREIGCVLRRFSHAPLLVELPLLADVFANARKRTWRAIGPHDFRAVAEFFVDR